MKKLTYSQPFTLDVIRHANYFVNWSRDEETLEEDFFQLSLDGKNFRWTERFSSIDYSEPEESEGVYPIETLLETKLSVLSYGSLPSFSFHLKYLEYQVS